MVLPLQIENQHQSKDLQDRAEGPVKLPSISTEDVLQITRTSSWWQVTNIETGGVSIAIIIARHFGLHFQFHKNNHSEYHIWTFDIKAKI